MHSTASAHKTDNIYMSCSVAKLSCSHQQHDLLPILINTPKSTHYTVYADNWQRQGVIGKMAQDVGMVWNVVVSFLSCLVGFWGFHIPRLFSLENICYMSKCKGSRLTWYNHCFWRFSSGICHCAAVCPQNATWTHWRINGEQCLVDTFNRIN